MASKQANKRLQKEYANLAKSPPPFCFARPNESNLLECHFIIRGPEESPYVGGEYHGVLLFPPQYPFAPGIKMYTPSGRFQPDTKICTSMSDFHPGSWNPAWSIETILTGLLSFMLSDEITTGSIRTTDGDKRKYAASSHTYNLKDPKFKAIFAEYAGELKPLPNMGEKERGGQQASTSATAAPASASAKSAAPALVVPGDAQAASGDRPREVLVALDDRERDRGGTWPRVGLLILIFVAAGIGSRLLSILA